MNKKCLYNNWSAETKAKSAPYFFFWGGGHDVLPPPVRHFFGGRVPPVPRGIYAPASDISCA